MHNKKALSLTRNFKSYDIYLHTFIEQARLMLQHPLRESIIVNSSSNNFIHSIKTDFMWAPHNRTVRIDSNYVVQVLCNCKKYAVRKFPVEMVYWNHACSNEFIYHQNQVCPRLNWYWKLEMSLIAFFKAMKFFCRFNHINFIVVSLQSCKIWRAFSFFASASKS